MLSSGTLIYYNELLAKTMRAEKKFYPKRYSDGWVDLPPPPDGFPSRPQSGDRHSRTQPSGFSLHSYDTTYRLDVAEAALGATAHEPPVQFSTGGSPVDWNLVGDEVRRER
jgi:hypothetical protein